jgi:hypothetical protein
LKKYFSIVGVVAAFVAVIAVLMYFAFETPPPPPSPKQTRVTPPSPKPPRIRKAQSTPAPREVGLWEQTEKPRATASRTAQPRPASQRVGSTSHAQQLLGQLQQMDLSRGITKAQAAEINALLQQLAEQGLAAVPAIREFLEQNRDVNFDSLNGGNEVDYASLRIGMLDVLLQVGGDEAVQTALQTLQATTDPLEIALLSRVLDEQYPEQYRQQALEAARKALALASSGQWDGKDVSPLFETLQKFGDASAVADLEKAVAQWNYYATLSLANLPDGAGISALVGLAKDPDVLKLGSGDFALRPLAQVALQYPEARTALIEDARANLIPDKAWPTVASALAGMYIQYGNHLFGTSTTVNWSNTQINQRIALIDQLLASTSNPTGVQSLKNARSSLVARLSK